MTTETAPRFGAPAPYPDTFERRSRIPQYIHACHDSSWHLKLTHLKTGKTVRAPFRCRSWRHAGQCRYLKANADGLRISRALEREEAPLCFLVLTVDPKDWRDTTSAYIGLQRLFQALIRDVRKDWGPTRYVNVIEQHGSRWPHLNVVLAGDIGLHVSYDAGSWNPDDRAPRGGTWQHAPSSWPSRSRLNEIATKAGFGIRIWVEPIRSKRATAMYIGKLSGELSKSNQVPLEAPTHFRRLRSSLRFLPAPDPSDWTGILLFEPVPNLDKHDPRPEKPNCERSQPPPFQDPSHESLVEIHATLS